MVKRKNKSPKVEGPPAASSIKSTDTSSTPHKTSPSSASASLDPFGLGPGKIEIDLLPPELWRPVPTGNMAAFKENSIEIDPSRFVSKTPLPSQEDIMAAFKRFNPHLQLPKFEDCPPFFAGGPVGMPFLTAGPPPPSASKRKAPPPPPPPKKSPQSSKESIVNTKSPETTSQTAAVAPEPPVPQMSLKDRLLSEFKSKNELRDEMPKFPTLDEILSDPATNKRMLEVACTENPYLLNINTKYLLENFKEWTKHIEEQVPLHMVPDDVTAEQRLMVMYIQLSRVQIALGKACELLQIAQLSNRHLEARVDVHEVKIRQLEAYIKTEEHVFNNKVTAKTVVETAGKDKRGMQQENGEFSLAESFARLQMTADKFKADLSAMLKRKDLMQEEAEELNDGEDYEKIDDFDDVCF